jgi:hypothetical protein
MIKLKTEQERVSYIKKYSRKSTPTQVRKEIGKIWKLKKTARNDLYRKLFSKSSLITEPSNILYSNEVRKETRKKAACPQVSIRGDKAVIETSNSTQIYTLEELIKVSELNMDEWTVKSFIANSYGQNFQAKAEFSRKKEVALKRILEEFKDDALNFAPNIDKIKFPSLENGKLLIVNIPDAHIGKLCNKEQTGHNYDLKIACEVYTKTLLDLVAKSKKQGGIEKIWYVVGNDYLTIDTPQNTTTRGTPQDVDTRFSKIFREGRKLLIQTVEILKQIAPVHIIVMPGNHDRSSMFHLGDALECWYHNDENVTVDNEDKIRKYYSHGEIAFGYTHGDQIKPDKLVQMGIVEYGKEWGSAKRRFWLIGHTHHYKVHNIQGTEIWTIPSISGSDDFHQANGYVGSTRQALAMVCSKDNLDAVFYSQPIEDKDYR